MTAIQKGMFFFLSGLILILGTVGGIEASPNLASYDGLYLLAFALVGLALMAIGVSYTQEVDTY